MSDSGRLNERILARDAKRDYLTRVEAPRKPVPIMLSSPEAKRLFVRFFDSMQLHVNFVSNVARSRLRSEDIEQVETMIEQLLDKGLADIDKALDGAEVLCKTHHISAFAEYAQDPLTKPVGVISSLTRKYLDLIAKFDQLMPMLATLEIDGVLRKKELDVRIATYKRVVKRVAYSTRELASGLRKRMNQLAETTSLADTSVSRSTRPDDESADKMAADAQLSDATDNMAICLSSDVPPVADEPADARYQDVVATESETSI